MSDIASRNGVPEASPDEIRAALVSVVSSEAFRGARRLQDLLTYVVEEYSAGRGDKIRAKLISEDVYKRPPNSGADGDNVVRVDAGRLRRRLDQYYLDAGRDDPLRIYIDAGGYAPRFEARGIVAEPDVHRSLLGKYGVVAATLIFAAVVVAGLVFAYGTRPEEQRSVAGGDPIDSQTDAQIAERQALLEKSPTALQAVNLAEQARGLIFPIFDTERLRLTTDMFRRVIKLDDHYYGGFAGAAQTLGMLAWISPLGPDRDGLQLEAQEMAARAMVLDPTRSWTQSAAAWVAFVGKNFERAKDLSDRSLALNPEDGDVLDFHALISLFSGDFKSAREVADPQRVRTLSNQRTANRNIYAAASFHLEEYTTTINSFQAAADMGDPVSPLTLVFSAAAHHALGNMDLAARNVKELLATWPDYRADVVLRRIYQHRKHADIVVRHLNAAGWVSPLSAANLKSAPE